MISSRNTTSISLASLMQSCSVVRSLSPLLVCPGEEEEGGGGRNEIKARVIAATNPPPDITAKLKLWRACKCNCRQLFRPIWAIPN